MNKIIKVLLAMCICIVGIACISISASAEDTSGSCGDYVTWKYEDGTLTISGTGKMTNYEGTNTDDDNDPKNIPWEEY